MMDRRNFLKQTVVTGITEAIFRQVADASEAADASGGRAGIDPTPIVFKHVSVVPMDGDRILPDQDVIIRGKLIASHEQVVPGPIHEVFRTKSKRDLVATKRQLKSNLDRTESTLRAVDDVLRVRSQHAPS